VAVSAVSQEGVNPGRTGSRSAKGAARPLGGSPPGAAVGVAQGPERRTANDGTITLFFAALKA
jgi:hypothetical protein